MRVGVLLVLTAVTASAQPLVSGYLAQPPPASEADRQALKEARVRADQDQLFAAAKEQLEAVLALEKDLRRAYQTADFHWYQTDLKSRPLQLIVKWTDQIDSLQLTDRYKAGVGSCGTAADALGEAMLYRFEQPSDHYYRKYLARYREDVDACKASIKLSRKQYALEREIDH